MRFSVQLLAIAATVLSFNATPREATLALPASVPAPTLQPVSATVDEEMREATEPTREHATEASPLAWLIAGGFLTLVVLRRTRSRPLD